ncbi:MAG TPA: D-glycerate dehydrogenase [Thermomicrobiales bacterium]|nr:D-glycerate dehydrogenase [Thermomicrobiales bacterium]
MTQQSEDQRSSTTDRPRVIVTMTTREDMLSPLAFAEIIRLPGPTARADSQEMLAESLPTVSAILTQGDVRIDRDLLSRSPQLRIVANMSRGYDNFDLEAMTEHGVWATNVPDAFTAPTAEVTIGLMLMVLRRLAEGSAHVRNGEWRHFEPGRWDGTSLNGKTLGIVGYGKIGRAVARVATAFDMRVLCTARPSIHDGNVTQCSLPELLAQSDVVSLHVPLSPETAHLINAETIAMMKPGAVLINTARGGVVDEAALTAALTSGKLAGAGLDVTEHEPDVQPELYALPNVVITPYLGGGTSESRQESQAHAIANVVAVLRGEAPVQPLNHITVETRA